ncbi:glycerophosphodiester phosphodiesterase family protein [Dyadobacter subterraneus]|uniref:Glycerophosphodiester phosphodiesterase family protein n=1 Tax=Dyadobacter subterraneus TaxID=2773304 RepID=A0ABR9WKN1_9BACT|nr:glycerophosphodiester phosphodiesterase family protein [Dyadobacter subterraneus]MBE9465992.1 glycerophosphodiester phosphodiesterase family protein [Dyadobacter subterraneus]
MSAYKNKFLLIQILFCFISSFSIGQNLPSSKHKLIVIAHRGNHVNVPENTLASTEEAIKYGVDYVEVDLRTTKDGHLIIHHDGTVDRATNGKGKISDHTLEEIKKLQVFNQNKKTYKIPEFRDILKLCKNKINIYLDFKDADVAQTWKQIQEAGMEKQIVVYINTKEQYPQWKSIAPQMPLMTSIPDEIKNTDQLSSFLNEIRISVIDNVVNPEMDKIIKEKKISTWLDVQSPTEGPASWDEAINKGVQGLQTDHPEALIEYLKKKGLR